MSHYQHSYYHNYYKNNKKRANLTLEIDEYVLFEKEAKVRDLSVNQCIRELALAQLKGVRPVSAQWRQWQQAVKDDLYRLGNEIHQLTLSDGHSIAQEEILEALFRHLQALDQKWESLYPAS